MRLFLGVPVSLATVRALEETALALQSSLGHLRVRWVAPACYHVTLKFLGWTRPPVVEALRDRIGRDLVGARAGEIEVRGLGAFPSLHKGRILWAGVNQPGAELLGRLAERVEMASTALGFAAESRRFHPHVTLARWKEPGDLAAAITPHSEQTYRSTWVDSVVLYQSKTKSGGSEYITLASWPLESSSKPYRRHTRPVQTGFDPVAPNLGSPEETPDGDDEG
jgi:2'-5' RNA ligase